ncbi:MAG: thioredoxin-dependent thiol peroxidase [bacterium]|nr:thioredoxin-dependent thiol peroxidase [bacterium]
MNLEPGIKAPKFTAIDHEGISCTNTDYAGKGLVIYFYPRAFTPGCTGESCDFRDNHQRFLDAGYEVVGVSPDEVCRLADFRTEYELPFPLLSDETHKMADDFGAWGMKKNYGKEYEGLIRSTIVVDPTGIIEHAWYNVRAKAHVSRVSKAVLETPA